MRVPTAMLPLARRAKDLARRLGLVAPLPMVIGPVRPDVALDIDRTEGSTEQVWRATRLPDSGPVPWLDRPDAERQVTSRLKFGQITQAQADICRKWIRDGYVVVPGLIDT